MAARPLPKPPSGKRVAAVVEEPGEDAEEEINEDEQLEEADDGDEEEEGDDFPLDCAGDDDELAIIQREIELVHEEVQELETKLEEEMKLFRKDRLVLAKYSAVRQMPPMPAYEALTHYCNSCSRCCNPQGSSHMV